MADYIRLRVTAAKAGVSMALLALLGGLADRARGATPARATQASSSPNFLKLKGLTSTISSDFLKVEKKLLKLNSSLSNFERNVGKTYLKIRSANDTFLKITDANAKFLKADATATNAAKLGGLTPDAFFQGHGNVVSGALSNVTSTPQQLLSLPGGIIVVDIAQIPGAGVQLTVTNRSGNTLPAVQDTDSGPSAVSMGDGSVKTFPIVTLTNGAGEIRVQVMPNGTFTNVVSILISLAPSPASPGQLEAVAQAFTGGV
jgi:hypothetical protein